MLAELSAITVGLVLSYFLKDIQFLSLDLHFLNTGLVYPDFLLIFIAFFALYRNELMGIWIGFFGGLLEDGTNWIFSSSDGGFNTIIGIHAFVYSLIGYIIGRFGSYFDNYHTYLMILLVFATVLLSRFFTWFLHGMIDNFNMNYLIVGPAVYTALLAPLWFGLLNWTYRISKTNKKTDA